VGCAVVHVDGINGSSHNLISIFFFHIFPHLFHFFMSRNFSFRFLFQKFRTFLPPFFLFFHNTLFISKISDFDFFYTKNGAGNTKPARVGTSPALGLTVCVCVCVCVCIYMCMCMRAHALCLCALTAEEKKSTKKNLHLYVHACARTVSVCTDGNVHFALRERSFSFCSIFFPIFPPLFFFLPKQISVH